MKILVSIFSTLCLSVSLPLYAAKVLLPPQEPVTLLIEGNIYTIPVTYTTGLRDFTYMILRGQRKVICHFHQQPTMTVLDPIPDSFEVGGRTIIWNCERFYDVY
jgi:hypothetical protein